ncbi:hypothetical protein FGO68_gene12374 [Halteria grandinella]|uniref:Uncharacterized protein n=1 Tax=Halteria grandinella TaxID=5974 RepID=A0A8J8P8C5_HALGN|nr:hypothetical protein FGO68_gene12374 [Halteria grandinella]
MIPHGQVIDKVNFIAQNSGAYNQGDYHAINWNKKSSLVQNYQNIQSSKNEPVAPISLNNNKHWANQGAQGGGAEGTPKAEGYGHQLQFQSKFNPQVFLRIVMLQ